MSSSKIVLLVGNLIVNMNIFSCRHRVVPGVFGNQLGYCIEVIQQMLTQALSCQLPEVSGIIETTQHLCRLVLPAACKYTSACRMGNCDG